MGSPAPVQGGYAPVGHGGGDPGCVGCGGGIGQVGGGGYPIAHGGPMTGGYPGMPAANGGYAGMPTTPGGYTAMPAGMVGANPPFTGYPSLLGPNGQPALGQPVASRPLPAPSVLPGGAK